MKPELLTRKEVAQILRLSMRSVDNLIAQSQLVSVAIGRRRLISTEALTDFVQNKMQGGDGRGREEAAPSTANVAAAMI